jgi:hypothetical protein
MKNKSEKVITKKSSVVIGKILVIVVLAFLSFAMILGTALNFAAIGLPTSCERSKM